MSKRQGGGGKKLSYLEGWDVKQTANEIFGFGNWGYEVNELVCIDKESFINSNGKEGIRVGYRATVEVWIRAEEGFPIRLSDVGYGDAQEYNGSRITPHELAAKEAVTDGMKRAFTSLGDQFGLCLYDKEAPEHEGKNADPLADLKNRVTELALAGGAERTAEGVALYWKTTPEELQKEEILRGLLVGAAS